jgi:predicted MFS family arabinose efflux permease
VVVLSRGVYLSVAGTRGQEVGWLRDLSGLHGALGKWVQGVVAKGHVKLLLFFSFFVLFLFSLFKLNSNSYLVLSFKLALNATDKNSARDTIFFKFFLLLI